MSGMKTPDGSWKVTIRQYDLAGTGGSRSQRPGDGTVVVVERDGALYADLRTTPDRLAGDLLAAGVPLADLELIP